MSWRASRAGSLTRSPTRAPSDLGQPAGHAAMRLDRQADEAAALVERVAAKADHALALHRLEAAQCGGVRHAGADARARHRDDLLVLGMDEQVEQDIPGRVVEERGRRDAML